ncbi:mucin-3A-like [Pelobates fuscus]|uniref:mucin-3A-like n=1 Tax=Pelobates fuscus TaxID=191477 RepID=UPI002FE4E141
MNNDLLCFTPNNTHVTRQNLNIPGICLQQLTIPIEVRNFYSPKNVSGVILCVSNCSTNSDSFINCNKGQCSVTQQGPKCYCVSSDQFWYSGDRCQVSISKPGVYGGVAAGLAVLLIIILTLAIILCRRRRQASEKLIDKENRWYEDGWEADGKGERSVDTESGASNFYPVLENVNTDVKMTVPRPSPYFGPRSVPTAMWESST